MNLENALKSLDFGQDDFPGQELHRALAQYRDLSPVGEVRMGGQRCWLIAGHEALSEAFRDEIAFPAGEWYPPKAALSRAWMDPTTCSIGDWQPLRSALGQ